MSEKRTLQQNKSLHKYCDLLAIALGDSGQDMRKVLKPEVEIPWTQDNVKEFMFKPIMSAMFPDIESTTDLDTVQIQHVYETLNRHTAQKLGVSVPWPSLEEQSHQRT